MRDTSDHKKQENKQMKRAYFFLLLIISISFEMKAQQFQWSNAISGSFDNKGCCCAADQHGNLYFAGKFSGSVTLDEYELTASEESFSMFLFKTDPDGKILWVKVAEHVSSNQSITPYDICLDDENNIYVVGIYYHQTRFDEETVLNGFNDSGDINSDCFIAKYKPEGDLDWVKGFFESRIGST